MDTKFIIVGDDDDAIWVADNNLERAIKSFNKSDVERTQTYSVYQFVRELNTEYK